ncbi:penicillin-binding protein 2 [Cytobacillus sp. S13-E01]|uniref:peptidoglycan D,D-transpeptidase FtsI family protein n=1 Tax=Cytobacillus sp. S13-E01 TaxID=3031326 RepID=UPI0023D7C332|nr:penicillin-binding protein 2 [Cytobacillus sp. S13-E01]MDF0727178.1 penicillin-binding protein 2 [Cytobacillus sp. S13-E01]
MKKKKKSHVPFRLNMLFFMVFLLFSALVLRLGVVQIVQGENYQKEVDRTENSIVSTPVPRGKIYDRFGRVIVDNEPLHAITYTRAQGTKPTDMVEVAKNLSTFIEKETTKLTERDIKDYWLITRDEKAKSLITKEELKMLDDKEITNNELYQLQLDRITEADLAEISEAELEVAAIFRELNKGYSLTPQIVKNNNVTNKEYAVVSEHLEELPGIDTTTDWARKYSYGSMIRSILGNTTTSEEGLPREKLDYYLARGYNRNDRVGKSYLEEQYEEVLHGQKGKIENITQGNNLLDTKVISEGERGKDLVLTIDMDLQQEVEKIIEEELLNAKKQPGTRFLDSVFVVMMDPKTGELLSMAGKKYVIRDGKPDLDDYALGTMNSAYTMGSAVKGATVLTGYQTGVLQIGSRMRDETLYIQGSPPKKSVSTLGIIDDLTALRRSSNVYMFKTGIAIANATYRPYKALPFDQEVFPTIRNYFSQFGLGVKTGIDLPGEFAGITGKDTSLPGFLLDLTIGQYDTYTPLQMAQYVSTIANGGFRMQPKIVREIRQPTMEQEQLGPVVKPFEPTILNKVDMSMEYIERVQEGFRQVMQENGGTALGFFGTAPYKPAGKTGTAESFYYDGEGKFGEKKKLYNAYNVTLVGYAPNDNPEVAFSVVVPFAYDNYGDRHPINNIIGRRVLDKYFELKGKERSTAPVLVDETEETQTEGQMDNSDE